MGSDRDAVEDLRRFFQASYFPDVNQEKIQKQTPAEPDPDTPEEFTRRGDALAAEGEIGQAIEHYRKAVQLGGQQARPHTRLADAYVYTENSAR
ncbi:MAG TPA: tetratricopeptide repeat protein, partial [Armatimonadota bacterium]|nr:tetratricopeptide repeat protein [Armatimonadota bacterium]